MKKLFLLLLLVPTLAFAGRQDQKDSPYATARWIAYLNRVKLQDGGFRDPQEQEQDAQEERDQELNDKLDALQDTLDQINSKLDDDSD
jgi:peptidoglycan hydrolase CwlO-like protein